VKEIDENFELIRIHRKKISAVCSDIKSFFDSIMQGSVPFHPPQFEIERLLKASLEGFIRRELSIFGSMTILERANKMDEVFILARTLFEVSVDAARFGIDFGEKPMETVGRISYAWHTNRHHLLKENPDFTDEQIKLLQSKIEEVPGLNKKEHEDIVRKKHFTGQDVRTRSAGLPAEKYYKPIYAKLSRYTHGMTFDSEIGFAKGYSQELGFKERICEEFLTLSYCSTMVLEHIKGFTPLIGLRYDEKIWQALFDRATEMADAIEVELGGES
jgi:hypothetical protein